MKSLVLNDKEISHNGKDMISLTDMWKAAGSPKVKAPKFWLGQDATQMFLEALSVANRSNPDLLLKKKKGGRGIGGNTEAHWQIALAYAKYLSPQFHIQCNEWIRERMEEDRNPELAIKRGRERAVASWKRKGWTDKEITERLKGIDLRNMFTSVLGSHDVKQKGFGDCTNAIYKYLFGGPAKLVREKLGLPEKSNPRDHMSFEQLHAVNIAEGLASNKIEEEHIYGNEKCQEACEIASKIAANAIHQMRKAKLSKSLY